MSKIKLMEENVIGNQPISITDPEAHIMLDKDRKWGFNYNFQSGVDDKYGMIAIHYITQSPNDQKKSTVTVKQLNERLHDENYTLIVDNGYWHIKSLKAIYNSPTTIVIPDKTSASRTKEKNNEPKENQKTNEKDKFRKHKFIKDWENDTYICPNDSILTRQNNHVQNGIEYKVYTTNDCLTCPDHDICTSQSKRTIKDRCDMEIEEIKKKHITHNGVKKHIPKEVHMLKETLEHYKSPETSEE